MPVDRNWTVPEENVPLVSYGESGELIIHPPRVVADDDETALAASVIEAIAILRRVGGTIQIASQRAPIAPGLVVTESYVFAYNSFTPLVRKLEEDAGDLTQEEIDQHFPDLPEPVQAATEEQAAAAETPNPVE